MVIDLNEPLEIASETPLDFGKKAPPNLYLLTKLCQIFLLLQYLIVYALPDSLVISLVILLVISHCLSHCLSHAVGVIFYKILY